MAWLEKRHGTWNIVWREAGKVRRMGASTDKQVANAKLGAFQKKQLRGEEYSDPYKDHRGRPIGDHVTAWITELRQAGCNEIYVYQCENRITRLATQCDWKVLGDISADAFIQWRATAKNDAGHNRKDKSKDEPGAMGPRTQNHYLLALNTFCRWCVRRKRWGVNPVADVSKVDELNDVRRARRALTVDEIIALIGAVPAEYGILYRVLLSTGLRVGEAAALRWGDIRTDAIKPYIQLRAETTKSKRADTLPLRAELADELRKARGDAGDTDSVFRRVPKAREHRRWLEAAKIPFTDGAGRRADLHALRHTYGTMLSKAGVSPRETMSLMRHTDLRLTMKVYTDPRVFDLACAVEKLPIPALAVKPAQAMATGTDGSGVANGGARHRRAA